MATIEYLHVCDYAFADQGGKQCLIGIFDHIRSVAFPVTHPMMTVAMRIRGSAYQPLSFKIELGRPNGDLLAGMEGNVVMGEDGSAHMQVTIGNVVFPEAGRYTFKVSSDGQTLTTHSIQVQKVQAPLQSAPPGSEPKKFH